MESVLNNKTVNEAHADHEFIINLSCKVHKGRKLCFIFPLMIGYNSTVYLEKSKTIVLGHINDITAYHIWLEDYFIVCLKIFLIIQFDSLLFSIFVFFTNSLKLLAKLDKTDDFNFDFQFLISYYTFNKK